MFLIGDKVVVRCAGQIVSISDDGHPMGFKYEITNKQHEHCFVRPGNITLLTKGIEHDKYERDRTTGNINE